MLGLSGWDVAVLAIAAYLSIVTLVRLMQHRRDQVVARLKTQVAAERARKAAEERLKRQKAGRERKEASRRRRGSAA